jgi:hypothetical protein
MGPQLVLSKFRKSLFFKMQISNHNSQSLAWDVAKDS